MTQTDFVCCVFLLHVTSLPFPLLFDIWNERTVFQPAFHTRDNYWSFFWSTSVLSLDTQEVCLYPATLTSISVPLYFNKSLHVLNTFYNYGLLGHKELFSVCVIFLMIVYGRPLSTILIWNDAMRIQLLVDIFLGVDWTILNHVFIISLLRFITCLLVTLQQILLEIFLLG